LGYGKMSSEKTAIAHHMMMNRQSIEKLVIEVTRKAELAEQNSTRNQVVVEEEEEEVPWDDDNDDGDVDSNRGVIDKKMKKKKDRWLLFVELIVYYSTPRPSEYELYHSFVFHEMKSHSSSTHASSSHAIDAATASDDRGDDQSLVEVAERKLVWDDWGSCCHDYDGEWISPVRAHEYMQLTVLPTGQHAEREEYFKLYEQGQIFKEEEWCDLDVMVEGLSKNFNYVACHRHLRPRI
jgi:hypothetical protein